MDLRNRVLASLNFVQTDTIPYTLPVSEPVAQQLDEHFGDPEWRSAIQDHVATLRVQTLPVSRSGKKVVKDAFGTIWKSGDPRGSIDQPALPEPDISAYAWPQVEDIWNEDALCAQIEMARERRQFIVVDTGPGIFERSCALRGYENALEDMLLRPDFYESLLEKIMDFQLALVNKLGAIGVDAIMLSDDWGNQGGITMGETHWRRFIKPRVGRYFEAVHGEKLWACLHCSGDVYPIIPDLLEIGMDLLQGLQPEIVDYYNLKRRYGHILRLWGGLGTLRFLPQKSPMQIRAEIDRLKVNMGFGGGFILAPSRAITPDVPLENTLAVLRAFTGLEKDK